jgi:hypothetical protein
MFFWLSFLLQEAGGQFLLHLFFKREIIKKQEHVAGSGLLISTFAPQTTTIWLILGIHSSITDLYLLQNPN